MSAASRPRRVRVIPCLDTKDGRVVKGVKFVGLRDAGDPVELAGAYAAQGAREVTFLDISATTEGRATTLAAVERCARSVSIPVTVGGGVRSVADVAALLDHGAARVGVNTAALARPDLIGEIAERFGSDVLVVAVDAQAEPDQPSGYGVVTHGGTRSAGVDAVVWSRRAAELGAGEILLTSMDADGTTAGFDLDLLRVVRAATDVPLVASGGAGTLEDFVLAAQAGADGVLGASVFHFGTLTVSQVQAGLGAAGFEV